MGKPKAEKGSCRKQKLISEFLYCPPCWEQNNKTESFFKYRNVETIGCCFLLHSNKAEHWKPLEPEDMIWKHPHWKWSGNDTSNDVDQLSGQKRRMRAATIHFVARPSGDANTFTEMIHNCEPPRKRVRRSIARSKNKELEKSLQDASKQELSEVILPKVWNELTSTRNGRQSIAKVITGLSSIYLPNEGGKSKAAINKAKKSGLAIVSGLSSALAPTNTEQFQSVLFGRRHLRNESVEPASAGAPMRPRNPKMQAAVLPSRKQLIDDSNIRCLPCSPSKDIPTTIDSNSTTTTSTNLFQHPVTVEGLDKIMPSDSDASSIDNDDSSSSDMSSSSNDSTSSEARNLKQLAKSKRRQERYVHQQLSRESMQGVTTKAVEEVRKTLGTELMKFIKDNCKTARERRPYLALVAPKHKRKDYNVAMETYVSKAEWNRSKVHAKWPGALTPVKKQVHQKLRIQKEILIKLIAFLDSPGNLQRLAFGRQVRELLGGLKTVEIDNVLRMKKVKTLVIQFLTGQMREIALITATDGSPVPDNKDRCPKLDKVTTFRCLKERCHDGKCNFTPKGSISPTSIRKLVQAMSPNEVKSLAGLDDTKVTKGRDNFHRLKEISKLLCDGQELKELLERIDKTEIFYQTDYINHLGRNGKHKCNCLTCGFHDKDTPTDIVCSDRDLHAPSCKKCADGFAIISKLLEHASERHQNLQQSFALVVEPSPPPPPPPPVAPVTATDIPNTSSPVEQSFSSMSLKLLKKACLERGLIQTGTQAAIVERLGDFETRLNKETGLPIKWDSYNNDFLKKACKERGIKQGGKKDELILRIQNHDAEQEEIARTTVPLRADLTDDEVVSLQSASELVRELGLRKNDLVEYRSHMARHLSEDEYAANEVRSLQDDEAIVTSDFKMKILSCYFRENQKKWFGKKGTTCAGFMVTTNPTDEESKAKGVKDVKFVMMLTNDGLQDDWMVACAKFRIYSEYLPPHIKKVHFVSDGAGCFKSQLHRAIQDKWESWTGVKEVSFRLTPAGDGKSALDGMFGRLNHVLRGSVDEGSSYYNAETIATAIEKSNGLASTHFAVFAPDRSKQVEVTFPKLNFEAILLTKLDPTRSGGLVAFKHSGFGSGQKVDLVNDVEVSWRCSDTGRRGGVVSPISNAYNNDRSLNTQVVMTMKPLCQEFLRTENSKSFMTTKLASRGTGAGDAAVRGRKKKRRIEAKAESKMNEYLKDRREMMDAGLFLCDAQCPRTGQFCRNIYQSQKARERHTKHNFPKGENAKDFFLREASKPGGLVEAGARPDRQSKELFEAVAAADDGACGEVDAHCFGRFNRKENVIGYKKPQKLLEVLEVLYNQKPQLRAIEFQDRMRRMRDNVRGGLLFCYEKRNTNGLLLSIDQIQSWINTRTQQKKNSEKHIPTEKDVQEAALLNRLQNA